MIFGCTDDNAGRLVLSRLATFFVGLSRAHCSRSRQQVQGLNGLSGLAKPAFGCVENAYVFSCNLLIGGFASLSDETSAVTRLTSAIIVIVAYCWAAKWVREEAHFLRI